MVKVRTVAKIENCQAIQRDVITKIPVPAGQVLVIIRHGEKDLNNGDFRAYSAGEPVDRKDLRMGIILHDGHSLTVNGPRGTAAVPKRVFNLGGKAVVEDGRDPCAIPARES